MDYEVQGSIPARGKTFFNRFYMDTRESEVIENYRPICHGLMALWIAAGL